LLTSEAELTELIKECFASVTNPSSEEEPLSQGPRPAKKRKIKNEDSATFIKKQEEVDFDLKQEDKDRLVAQSLQASFDSERQPRRVAQTPAKGVAKKKKPKKIKAKSNALVDSDDDGSNARAISSKQRKALAANPFNKLMRVSAQLEDICGEPYVSRPQVSKRVWAYIKERNLQDPNDKRYIHCDDRLQNLLKTPRVHMFTMTKLLQPHMWDDGTDPQMGFIGDDEVKDVKPKIKPEVKEEHFDARNGAPNHEVENEDDDAEHAWLYESAEDEPEEKGAW
jgi:upstream activation factor subunit UAF30